MLEMYQHIYDSARACIWIFFFLLFLLEHFHICVVVQHSGPTVYFCRSRICPLNSLLCSWLRVASFITCSHHFSFTFRTLFGILFLFILNPLTSAYRTVPSSFLVFDFGFPLVMAMVFGFWLYSKNASLTRSCISSICTVAWWQWN